MLCCQKCSSYLTCLKRWHSFELAKPQECCPQCSEYSVCNSHISRNVSGKTAYIVDDEPEIINLLTIFFEARGMTVHSNNTGADCTEEVKRIKPDIVILDILLPVTSGFEICKSLKQLDVYIPVIMLSVKNKIQDKIDGFRVGADMYIEKPFDLEVLFDNVLNLLHLSQENRKLDVIKNIKLLVTSTMTGVKNATKYLEFCIENVEITDMEKLFLRLAIDEALTNSASHAHNWEGNLIIKVEYLIYKDKITVSISDQGEGFELPDFSRVLENPYRENGRGIFLLKNIMDEVEYHFNGKLLSMTKHFEIKKS